VRVRVCVCLTRELCVTGMWTFRARDAQFLMTTHTFAVSLGKAHAHGGAFEELRLLIGRGRMQEKGPCSALVPPPARVC